MPKRALAFIFILLIAGSFRCRPTEANGQDPARGEALSYLKGYLQIDTSNPPGDETRGAQFLKNIFATAGIESRLLGDNPARQSLFARLPSGSTEPALLLLSHIDVVPVKAAEWSVPPFSARESGGYLWGRGALDIKSLGIAELMALLELKREGVALHRDVIFLAVADEEAGGAEGTAKVLAKYPELFRNVGFVLNEGGSNETVVDKVQFWGIETAQKVPLWVRLTCRGESGHGAVPPDDGGSAAVLVQVLESLREIPLPYRLTPPVKHYLAQLALQKKGSTRDVLLDPERYFDSPDFQKLVPVSYRSLLRDTLAITRIDSGISPNVIPATSTAVIDIRLLPGSNPDETLQRIRDAVAGRASIEVLLRGEPAPESPAGTELYSVLQRVMLASEPGSSVGQIVSAGTTDSRFFRARGITAYGISPFKVNYYDADTIHGIDERIRVEFFHEGVKVTEQIVRGFCARNGG